MRKPFFRRQTKCWYVKGENEELIRQGLPWTKAGIILRFHRMKTWLGIESDVTAYSYRHTFATDSLLTGVDIVHFEMGLRAQ